MGRKVLLILDGAADNPVASLEGRTPLEAAYTPFLDALAAKGEVGLTLTVPPEFTAASDVANLMLLGHDPHGLYTGRGPLEAAAMGVKMAAGEIAFRVNTVSLTDDGRMKDYSAGHISTEEAHEIVLACKELIESTGGRVYPGVQYRHLMVHQDGLEASSYPPHDNIGRLIVEMRPTGTPGKIFEESQKILRDHPVNVKRRAAGKNTADALWPWGQGRAIQLPSIRDQFGADGVLVSAVDLIRGLGVLAGFRILSVPGITGYHDTNYAGKATASIAALKAGADVAVIHVESPDEAGHEKDAAMKVQAIEAIDREIVGRLVAEIPDLAIVAVPDHATHVATGLHGAGPVPWLFADLKNPMKGPAGYAERFASGPILNGSAPFQRLMRLP